ncbi:hypothetical protein BURK1_02248 [Burkholderiales bacterium]|nr:hypothetical protein BURK1_02248 [Burkholderiales bacterium]
MKLDAAHTNEQRDQWGRIAALFVAAFAVSLALAVALHAGPRLRGAPASIDVPGSAMRAVKGRGHVDKSAFVLDAPDTDGMGVISAATPTFDGDEYTRVAWRIESLLPAGVELDMIWRKRERPGRTFTAPLTASDGDAIADLGGHADWSGSIHGVALVLRSQTPTSIAIGGFAARSNAWGATLADIVGQWFSPGRYRGRAAISQMSHESEHVAPMLTVVAGGVGLGVAFLMLRARRRKETVAPWAVAALFLAGWLVLDLRWQMILWRQHAAAVAQFAGKSPDEQYLADADGKVFEIARKVRDAPRARPARILLLTPSTGLRTRIAWFLYPENVYYDSRMDSRATVPAPEQLRTGDQVLLLLYGHITWDRERGVLAWPDGRTRAAREILYDGPEFSLVEIT